MSKLIEMNADEKFEALKKLQNKLETNFIELGAILKELKSSNEFKLKGYRKFKDFVQNEYGLSSAFATKLINTYKYFVEEQKIDEETLKQIGFEKLQILKRISQDILAEEIENKIQNSVNEPLTDLKEELSEIRESKRKKNLSMEDVLTDQWKERMTTHFNCSFRNLLYKLSLYFQDSNLDEVKDRIKNKENQLNDKLGV